jgi:hypothetical protein
MLGTYACA